MTNFDHLFPDELDALLADRTRPRIAVLPIGSVEQHGPHLLLGCDGYIARATAQMVAEKVGGVLCPMLPFSWIGGLRPYFGTIDMRPLVTADYMEAVCLELLRQGFDRLVLVNCHGGGREMVFSVARRVFKRTGKPVVSMYPTFLYDNWPELASIWTDGGMDFDWSSIEAAELCGGLLYSGREDLSDKVIDQTRKALAEFGDNPQIAPQPGLDGAFGLSEVGHDYLDECQHVHPVRHIVPETAIKALDFMAGKIAQAALAVE